MSIRCDKAMEVFGFGVLGTGFWIPAFGGLCITPISVIPNAAQWSEESKIPILQAVSRSWNGPG